uniref:Uncharacterized protein n=1 Tax=uncultured haloarchaeon TaxID=160804 RepID=A0A0K1YBQ9_9EURY|nr:hypothetical protein [uncultured haloarchaeon]
METRRPRRDCVLELFIRRGVAVLRTLTTEISTRLRFACKRVSGSRMRSLYNRSRHVGGCSRYSAESHAQSSELIANQVAHSMS